MSTENAQAVIDEPTHVDLARELCAMSDKEDFEVFAETVRGIAPYVITPLARAVIAAAALADQLDAEGDQLQHTGRLPDVPAGMERQAVAARIRTALNGENA